MMDYKNEDACVYGKAENKEAKAGARVAGNDVYSVLEAEAHAKYGELSADAGGQVQVFHLNPEHTDLPVEARFFGADIGVGAGLDIPNSIYKGEAIFGAEAKARLTMTEAKAGPFNLHLGLGVSTGATMKDGTVEAKLAGTGLKVGKKIGVAVFDNEFSIDTLALVGKGWLW